MANNSLQIIKYKITQRPRENAAIGGVSSSVESIPEPPELVTQTFDGIGFKPEFLCEFMEYIRLSGNAYIQSLPMVKLLTNYYNQCNITKAIEGKCNETTQQYKENIENERRKVVEQEQQRLQKERDLLRASVAAEEARVQREKDVATQRNYYLESIKVRHFTWYEGSWAYVYYARDNRVVAQEAHVLSGGPGGAWGGYQPKVIGIEPTEITCGLLSRGNIITEHRIDIEAVPEGKDGNYFKFIKLENDVYNKFYTYDKPSSPNLLTPEDKEQLLSIFNNLEANIKSKFAEFSTLENTEKLKSITNLLANLKAEGIISDDNGRTTFNPKYIEPIKRKLIVQQ